MSKLNGHRSAMRSLVLLALHRKGGVINDTNGYVPTVLRKCFGIPASDPVGKCISAALGELVEQGRITRDMYESQTRTYEIKLVRQLEPDEIAALEASECDDLALFGVVLQPTAEAQAARLQVLVKHCTLAYAALQRAATREDRRVDGHGNVAINATGEIQAAGVPRKEARRIKYYLRVLGVAKSLTAVSNDPNEQLWWWFVDGGPLNTELLRELATDDRSYEADCARRRGVPKAGPVTTRRVGDAAAPAARPNPNGTPPPEETASPAPADEVDPLEALVAIVEALEAVNEALRRQLEAQQLTHQNTVDGLQARIDQLEEELRRHQQAGERARALIARHRPGT